MRLLAALALLCAPALIAVTAFVVWLRWRYVRAVRDMARWEREGAAYWRVRGELWRMRMEAERDNG